MGGDLRGIRAHASELGHAENFIVSTYPVRPVQHWAFGGKFYCQGNQQHRWRKQRQRDECQSQIENALRYICSPAPARCLHWPIQLAGYGIWNGNLFSTLPGTAHGSVSLSVA